MSGPNTPEVKGWSVKRAVFFNALFYLFFLVVAALIVRQWGSPHPWARADFFFIAVMLFSVLMGTQQLILYWTLLNTRERMLFFSGMQFDPTMFRWIAALGVAEMLAFADHAHWNLVPALRNPVLQSVGLALFAFDIFWLRYIDRYLARNFTPAWENHRLMTSGPYRWVRHPRYSALLYSRIAFTLAIASIIAWVLLLGWIIIISIRVRREERYLLQQFGSDYVQFMQTRARFLPGVY